ncbi:hypothetical protein GIB67_020152 [Kingdonia uniflora]|uniref:Uncharacterized protein n=1 Tax=Kingdonia uniflora TaxID=39325 RepID=A0A7J7NIK6_9MAGN|nr:hypothetical protein GIB67_020152 [Kingdonia uniflora]
MTYSFAPSSCISNKSYRPKHCNPPYTAPGAARNGYSSSNSTRSLTLVNLKLRFKRFCMSSVQPVTANSVRLVRLSAKEVVQWHSLAGSSVNVATANATQMMQGNIWEIPNICGLAQSMVTYSNSNRHPRGMSGNSLTGSLSPDMCQLTGLWYLSLQGNKHSGKIPEVIGLMQVLAVLDLSENKLVGPILTIIGNLSYIGKLLRQTRMRCLRK